jgi:hypothetical protein
VNDVTSDNLKRQSFRDLSERRNAEAVFIPTKIQVRMERKKINRNPKSESGTMGRAGLVFFWFVFSGLVVSIT